MIRYGGGAIKVEVEESPFAVEGIPQVPSARVRVVIMGVATVYLTTGEATAVAEALVEAIKRAREVN